MEKLSEKKRFTLKTKEGCQKLFGLCVAIILVASMCARFVSTDGGKIKNEQLTIDARGAAIAAELYYPAGVSDKDSLPAIVVAHGGGCTYGVTRGIALEFARRGFVVLNVDAYGAGLSEMPVYDDNGMGLGKFVGNTTPAGMLDALNFVRTLKFVDQTRIGMAGHSQGSRRSAYTAVMDCGYLSFNDIMVNVLFNTFGQKFTQTEINTNADTLAKARLNNDQLATYNILKETNLKAFNSKLKALCLFGSDGAMVNPQQSVTVAGFKVSRNCQVNIGYFNGLYDSFYYAFPTKPATKQAWYIDTKKDITLNNWYSINDVTASSTVLGGIFDISVKNNTALATAIQNRATRILVFKNAETHSKEFLSTAQAADMTKYFEQTLGYNKGNLTNASTTPLDINNQIWPLRTAFNTIAMFAMFAMFFPLLGWLLKGKFFAPCLAEVPATQPKINKLRFWILSALTVALGFGAIYYANLNGLFLFAPNDMLPLVRTGVLTCVFIWAMGLGALIILAINFILDARAKNYSAFKMLNIKMKFKNIMKILLLALILIGVAYLALMVVDYFFHEDFRLWMTTFNKMKASNWFIALRYAVILFPAYFVMSAAINYAVRKDIPVWKDTLISVIVNSLGIWICCLITTVMLRISYNGVIFSNFLCSYQVVLLVPVTTYISRKAYNMTKNIWVGALLSTFLIVWSMASSLGVNDVYIAQTWWSNFLGL